MTGTSDPFGERSRTTLKATLHVMGARVHFDSNSRELLRLVDQAYGGLPRHKLSTELPDLRISLRVTPPERGYRISRRRPRSHRAEPPPVALLHGAGLLGGSTDSSHFVIVSPGERAALVVVSGRMLTFPYHTRYELIEFAVFTLAARTQGLVSMHAACVGRNGRGILLMGRSGAGKSTVALQCLLRGWDFLAEDSVFVAPDTLLATGVANFVHVRSDSLRWIERARDRLAVRRSPVIRRRSGVKKFEVDLRNGKHQLADSPLKVVGIVFLSRESAAGGPRLRPLTRSLLLSRLLAEQAYAASQPPWTAFKSNLTDIHAYELRRGRHPLETVEAMQNLLESRAAAL